MASLRGQFRWIWLLPVLLSLCGMFLLVADTRPQQALRNLLFDQYQRWQPRDYVDTPVRIIDIDEESLARFGQWPWPRTRIADLLEKVGAGGTAHSTVVAFDILFAEPDRTSPRIAALNWPLSAGQRAELGALPDHDAVFARALARAPTVLGFIASPEASPSIGMPARFVDVGHRQADALHVFPGAVPPLPELAAAASGLGALSFVADHDGIVRRVPLVLGIAAMPVPTLTSETLRVREKASHIALQWTGAGTGLSHVRIGRHAIPATPAGEVWVHYTQPAAGRYVPAWKVFDDPATRADLAGKMLFVGSSAQGLLDLRFTPFGPVPGVEIHAQALEQVLLGHYLRRPAWANGAEAVALLLAGLGIGFIALRARALVSAAVCVLVLGALFATGWQSFAGYGLLLDVVTPVLGTLLTFIACSLAHHFGSERKQRWIKAAFARYVSPNRVEYLVRHPEAMELGGRRQECSFIFTDLENFTTLIETIEPARAVALLNAYLEAMIAIVFRHEGTLDRIVGDALVVMFSAPVRQQDHKQRALACALEMDAFASRYSAEQQAQGIAFGRTRIGVHAGTVTVGNFGGSTMFDYRALGDPINTAARLESANKHLGTRMCISAAILEGCAATPVRPVGRLILKGKTDMIEVFEPLLPELEAGYAPLDGYLAAFAAMQACSGSALALFERLLADNPGDPLVKLHRNRLLAGERGELIVMQGK